MFVVNFHPFCSYIILFYFASRLVFIECALHRYHALTAVCLFSVV